MANTPHYVEQLSGGSCLFSYLDNVLEMFIGCTSLHSYQRKYRVLYEKAKIPPTSLASPIAPIIREMTIPDSNPATKAKPFKVQNASVISLEELLK